MKFRLIKYTDVLGNPNDGWKINGESEFCRLECVDNYCSGELVEAIKQTGFLAKDVRRESLVILYGESGLLVDIRQVSDEMPLCRLELFRDWDYIPDLVKSVHEQVDSRPEDAPPPVAGFAQRGVYAIQMVDGKWVLHYNGIVIGIAQRGFDGHRWESVDDGVNPRHLELVSFSVAPSITLEPDYEHDPNAILAMNTMLSALQIGSAFPMLRLDTPPSQHL